MPNHSVPGRILILGATSAIAMAVARRFAKNNAGFYLVARNSDRLESVAQDLKTRGAAYVKTRIADLENTVEHKQIVSDAAETLGVIDMALVAHGILGDQQKAESDFEEALPIIRANFLSTASLITVLANYFESRKSGVLAVISSVAGDRGRKSNYVYGASKAAVNVYLDGVRNRLDRHGVHVLTIRPGFVSTPMTSHLKQGLLFASPEAVAKGIHRAIRRRHDIAYLPWFWRPIMAVIKAIPEKTFKRLNF
jgi:decaprenylphospho-beta-D-erythro-pentofuranosid-2-ulose 2-reductase